MKCLCFKIRGPFLWKKKFIKVKMWNGRKIIGRPGFYSDSE